MKASLTQQLVPLIAAQCLRRKPAMGQGDAWRRGISDASGKTLQDAMESEEEAWEEMMADPRQFADTAERSDYLTRHIEVDAFAHEAAEQLLDIYSADEAYRLIKIRAPELRGVVRDYLNVLGDNPTELKKFWTKLYTQIERQK